jgi:hypothetical protein
MQGVYRFLLGKSNKWQLCPPETKNWDYYHQMTFRQHKAQQFEFSEIANEVPPLPGEFPPPVKYHVKDPSGKSLLESLSDGALVRMARRALPGSQLFNKTCAATESRLAVYVVLIEDTYESAFGDGIFRCFESAHLKEDAAKTYIDEYQFAPDEKTDFFIRSVYLTVSGWSLALDTGDCDLSRYDDFTKKQIATDLKHPGRRRNRLGQLYSEIRLISSKQNE